MEQIYNKFTTALHWDFFRNGLQGNYSRLNESQVRQLDKNSNERVISQISLNPASIAGVLGAVTFILVFASVATQSADYLTGHNSAFLHKMVKVFNLDLEQNVSSFFSMLLLLFTSLLLAFITVLKRKQKASYLFEWAILSIGFLFMTFDESTQIHEKLIEPMRAILGGKNLGIFYYAWVVPAIGLVLFLSLFFLKFLWSLPAKPRLTFIISGIIYIGGAIGMELIGGNYAEIHGRDNLIYIALTTIEESLEMLGVIVFIWALLEYIAVTYGEIEVQLDGRCETAETAEKNFNVAEKFIFANK